VLGALTAATWLAYGTWLLDGPQLIANIPSVCGGTAIVVLIMVRTRSFPRWAVLLPLGWAAVAAGCGVLSGVSGVGLAATGIGLLARFPQVGTAFVSEDLAGISLPTQWLSLASAVLWFGYGLGSHLLPVILSSSTAALLIVAVIVPTRRAGRTVSVPAVAVLTGGRSRAVDAVPHASAA